MNNQDRTIQSNTMANYIDQFFYIQCLDGRVYSGWLKSVTGNHYNLSPSDPNTGLMGRVSISMSSIDKAWVVKKWELKPDYVIKKGNWELRVFYRAKGTKSEGTHGILYFNGEMVIAKYLNEEIETDLGLMKYYGDFPSDVKHTWDPSGWNYADVKKIWQIDRILALRSKEKPYIDNVPQIDTEKIEKGDSRNRGCNLLKLLPKLLDDYDKAMLNYNDKEVEKILNQSSKAVQDCNEQIDYSNKHAKPSDYRFISDVLRWIKKNIPYTNYQKEFLIDLMTYFTNLARDMREIVTKNYKHYWNELLEEILDINKLLIKIKV